MDNIQGEQATLECIADDFVRQYYTLLNKAPEFLHRFYRDDSSFAHGDESTMVFGQRNIRNRINELNFHACSAKIIQMDCQAAPDNGIVVQVFGTLCNDGLFERPFTQTFVLAARSRNKYYVLNNIFRYQDTQIKAGEGNRNEPETHGNVELEGVKKTLGEAGTNDGKTVNGERAAWINVGTWFKNVDTRDHSEDKFSRHVAAIGEEWQQPRSSAWSRIRDQKTVSQKQLDEMFMQVAANEEGVLTGQSPPIEIPCSTMQLNGYRWGNHLATQTAGMPFGTGARYLQYPSNTAISKELSKQQNYHVAAIDEDWQAKPSVWSLNKEQAAGMSLETELEHQQPEEGVQAKSESPESDSPKETPMPLIEHRIDHYSAVVQTSGIPFGFGVRGLQWPSNRFTTRTPWFPFKLAPLHGIPSMLQPVAMGPWVAPVIAECHISTFPAYVARAPSSISRRGIDRYSMQRPQVSELTTQMSTMSLGTDVSGVVAMPSPRDESPNRVSMGERKSASSYPLVFQPPDRGRWATPQPTTGWWMNSCWFPPPLHGGCMMYYKLGQQSGT